MKKTDELMVQPTSFTYSKFDADPATIRLMVSVFETLQDLIKQSIRTDFDIEKSDCFVRNEGSTLNIELPLSKIAKEKKHYNETKLALAKVANIPISIPFRDEETGDEYTSFGSFCRIEIPRDSYRTRIRVKIDKIVLTALLSGKLGYQEIFKPVIIEASSRYTQRFYMLCSAWKHKGNFSIKIDTLREYFAITAKYERWASFKKRVIEVPQDEMKRLYDAGRCECYFTCQYIYSAGKSKGWPLSVKIFIHLSEDETHRLILNEEVNLRITCESLLRDLHILKSGKKMLSELNGAENIEKAISYLRSLSDKLDRERQTISSPSNYALTSFRHFVDKLNENPGKSKDIELPEEKIDPYLTISTKYKSAVMELVEKEIYETWFVLQEIELVKKVKDEFEVLVMVPNDFFRDTLRSRYMNIIEEAFTSILEKKTTVKFITIEEFKSS